VGASGSGTHTADAAPPIGERPRIQLEACTTSERINILAIQNFFTVDIECWFHSYNVQRRVSRARWRHYPPRLIEPVRSILKILDARDVKATFFVLGWVADAYPDVVRMIDERGHEIASHGYSHDVVTSMSVSEFRRDTIRSLEALSLLTTQGIMGYRASNFSITTETLWALDILNELEFIYDSSVFPVRRGRYGIRSYPVREPHRLELSEESSLYEFPLAKAQIGNVSVPFAGGGYLRLYPSAVTEMFLRKQNADGRPVVVYTHPWELDVEQPRAAVDLRSRFLNYVGLSTTATKLESLLARFPFGAIRDTLASDEVGARTAATSVRIDSLRAFACARAECRADPGPADTAAAASNDVAGGARQRSRAGEAQRR
jgi:polysaccharide deacetylase family protein (PEP-CTERM system associated)